MVHVALTPKPLEDILEIDNPPFSIELLPSKRSETDSLGGGGTETFTITGYLDTVGRPGISKEPAPDVQYLPAA